MHVVRDTGVSYYVGDLAAGRAEETLVAGESPGIWAGGGSGALSQRGQVDSLAFRQVLAGRDPMDDRTLRDSRGTKSVAGVDLVFCAPKSVSVLHLLAPRELADAAGSSHEAAVADAVGYLERVALGVRRRRGGVTHHVATTGVVAAGFVHRTSRALDPHLHTHLVMANVAEGVDGTWSATDTRRLFLHRRAMGSIYDASLRHELTVRTGISWAKVGGTGERVASARWDVAGIDPVLLRLFSQRAASIDEFVHRRTGGHASMGVRRTAFHAERPDKDQGQTVEGLRSAWRSRANDFGVDPSDLIRLVGRASIGTERTAVDRDALGSRLEQLGTKRGWLASRDLVAAVADSSPGGLSAPQVERVAAALVAATTESNRSTPDESRLHVDARVERRWDSGDIVRSVGATLEALSGPSGSRDSLNLDGRLGQPNEVSSAMPRTRERTQRVEREPTRAAQSSPASTGWDRSPARSLDR